MKTQFSENRKDWHSIPKEVHEWDSNHALLLASLSWAAIEFDQRSYDVAKGFYWRNREHHRWLDIHLGGRQSKACAIKKRRPRPRKSKVQLALLGQFKEPYAVYLR